MLVIVLTVVILLSVWVSEYIRHQRNIKSIQVRIHVNGARGKSSVTRLIAAGLRAGGIKTWAKTTGTLPRIIDEEGLEIPIPRPHGVNIIEQLGIVDFLRRRSPQALVMECMAIQPEFQWICEHRMIHSTIGVITNVRLDHIREMGPSIKNVTLSLCNTLPKDGIAFTSEKKMFPLMQKAAEKSRTNLKLIDGKGVFADELAGFHHVEHEDNVALSLAVCQYLGVNRETALKGMYKAYPDVGAMKIFKIEGEKGDLYFINALAANDPDSTLEIWNKLEVIYRNRNHLTVLLNARADRFERSVQLLEMCKSNIPFDKLVLIGQKLEQVVVSAVRLKIPREEILMVKTFIPEQIYHKLQESIPTEGLSVIFAIGNMGGGGLQVANYFSKLAQESEMAVRN